MESTGVPALIHDLSKSCVRAVQKATGVALDFHAETLPILDHYAKQESTEGEQQLTPELLGLLAPMLGAYFGEVVRNALPGARWHAPGEDYMSWRIEFDPCFLHFNPVGVALEVLTEKPNPDFSPHFEVLPENRKRVQEALETFGAVREKDFYTFTIRFESLEQMYEHLPDKSTTKPLLPN